MDRTRIPTPSTPALALVLFFVAACAVAQTPSRGSREERALRRSHPIYLELDERRLVDRKLVERIFCAQGTLVVRPFGRTALVSCELHAPSLQIGFR
jgi:hypothetical protein